MGNFAPLSGYPFGVKAQLSHNDVNTISEDLVKCPNASDGSSHAPSADLEWSGANGGGFKFSTVNPVPFYGNLDTTAGLTFAGDVTITGDLSITTTGDIATTGTLAVTAATSSNDTAIAGTGDGSGAGVVGIGGTGVLGTGTGSGTSFGVVGNSTGSGNVIGVFGGGHGTGAGGKFQGGATGTGVIAIGGGGGAAPALEIGVGGAVITATDPATNVDPGADNMLFGLSLIKAAAYITTDGMGGYTVHDGYNIDSCTVTSAYVLVKFKHAFTNATYWPAVTSAKNPTAHPIADMAHGSTTASQLVVAFENLDSGGTLDPAGNAVAFTLLVGGRQ